MSIAITCDSLTNYNGDKIPQTVFQTVIHHKLVQLQLDKEIYFNIKKKRAKKLTRTH